MLQVSAGFSGILGDSWRFLEILASVWMLQDEDDLLEVSGSLKDRSRTAKYSFVGIPRDSLTPDWLEASQMLPASPLHCPAPPISIQDSSSHFRIHPAGFINADSLRAAPLPPLCHPSSTVPPPPPLWSVMKQSLTNYSPVNQNFPVREREKEEMKGCFFCGCFVSKPLARWRHCRRRC